METHGCSNWDGWMDWSRRRNRNLSFNFQQQICAVEIWLSAVMHSDSCCTKIASSPIYHQWNRMENCKSFLPPTAPRALTMAYSWLWGDFCISIRFRVLSVISISGHESVAWAPGTPRLWRMKLAFLLIMAHIIFPDFRRFSGSVLHPICSVGQRRCRQLRKPTINPTS